MDFDAAPGVYVITCNVTGERYVGSTLNCRKRWQSHLSLLRRNAHTNWLLQGLWERYGDGCLRFRVVRYFKTATRRKLIQAERIVIDRVRPSLNIVKDPDRSPSLGGHSEETKKKIGDAHRGHTRPGHPCPEHVKTKLSRDRKGKRLRPLGYRHSEETKAKIGASNSKALKGKPRSEARRAAHERRMGR